MNWCHLFLHTAHTALSTSHFLKNLIIIQNLLWIYKLYIVWMLYSIKSSINSSLLFICFNNTLNHHQSYSFKNPLSSSSLLSPVERFPTDINAWPFDVGLGLRWTRTLQRGLIPDTWYMIPDIWHFWRPLGDTKTLSTYHMILSYLEMFVLHQESLLRWVEQDIWGYWQNYLFETISTKCQHHTSPSWDDNTGIS